MPTSSGAVALSSSDPAEVRQWLLSAHPKQLASLDKFEMELRLGRLSTSAATCHFAAAATTTTTRRGDNIPSNDRRLVTTKTVELLQNLIGSTRWKNAAELLSLLRGVGRELEVAGGFREPAIGNVVRRIMAAVRVEVMSIATTKETQSNAPSSSLAGRPTLDSMLWALPQHVKHVTTKNPLIAGDRQESFSAEAEESDLLFPQAYYVNRPDLKQSVMEAIQEIMSDLEDVHKNINDQATSHIHAGEMILTYGWSKTVELFLKAAAAKKIRFQVVVCEGAPHYGGHDLAKSLKNAGIETMVIHDSACFAVMTRVNKVLLPAHAVLANGGLVVACGTNIVALAARQHAVPVVCLTGMFKLCPMFPHEEQDTLNDLLSPISVVDYAEMRDPLMSSVEFANPMHDYIKPELIDLYVTNVGSFQPSYLYRLLAEYYHSEDWESFE